MNSTIKIRDLDDLARVLQGAKDRNRTVGLCNGVFDILHVGHVRYLEAARQHADVIVVAINDDDSTRAIKGEGRPVVPAAERAELVAALWCVDWVTLFSEPDVGHVLERIRPDFHLKGTDYTVESVPERDIAASIGARVLIVGDPKDHSASALIGRLRSP